MKILKEIIIVFFDFVLYIFLMALVFTIAFILKKLHAL